MDHVLVRTAYPNIFAEAAETLGIEVFQQVVEVELTGERFDKSSLVAVDELRHLEKLVVSDGAHVSDCNLAEFSKGRPEVEVVVRSTKREGYVVSTSDRPVKRALTIFMCPSSSP